MDVFLAPLTHGCGIGASSLLSVTSLRTNGARSSADQRIYGFAGDASGRGGPQGAGVTTTAPSQHFFTAPIDYK